MAVNSHGAVVHTHVYAAPELSSKRAPVVLLQNTYEEPLILLCVGGGGGRSSSSISIIQLVVGLII